MLQRGDDFVVSENEKASGQRGRVAEYTIVVWVCWVVAWVLKSPRQCAVGRFARVLRGRHEHARRQLQRENASTGVGWQERTVVHLARTLST